MLIISLDSVELDRIRIVLSPYFLPGFFLRRLRIGSALSAGKDEIRCRLIDFVDQFIDAPKQELVEEQHGNRDGQTGCRCHQRFVNAGGDNFFLFLIWKRFSKKSKVTKFPLL